MEQTQARTTTSRPVIFRDGIGRRCRLPDSKGNDRFEVLCVRNELVTGGSFELALRERVGRLTSFRHEAFARVRSVDHMRDAAATLVLVSECTPGLRLSDLLVAVERSGIALDGSAGWYIIRQLVSAVATLHEHAPDIAHGAIAPERVIITPDARVVLVEHVLGGALEGLQFSHERYWRELRIACPRSAGSPSLDLRADVMQLGVVALSLILGRLLRDDEYPSGLEGMVESAWITSVNGDHEPMPASLRSWLDRALQLDERRSFASAIEACAELDRVLEESASVLVPLALEAFLARFNQRSDSARRRAAVVSAPPTEIVPPVASMSVVETAPPHAANPALRFLHTEERAFAPLDQSIAPHAETTSLGGDPTLEAKTRSKPDAAQPKRTLEPPVSADLPPSTRRSRRPAWTQRAWGRQTIVATLLTVVCGAGWVAASRLFDARSERAAEETLASNTFSSGPGVTPPALAPALTPTGPASEGRFLTVANDLSTSSTAPEPAAATFVAPVPAPTPSGWIAVSAANDLQVYENGLLLGTSRGGRIALPTGTHQLEFVNDVLGYRSTRTVQVRRAETASISVEFPNGTLALNATPWAEVLIDGKSVGETPIGNLPISVGSHDVVFRHPELGERRMAAIVTVTAPTRLSVDLRKQ